MNSGSGGTAQSAVGQHALEVPAGLRLPRLERILGCRLQHLTVDVVQRLVTDHATEDLVLEFKGELYEPGNRGNDEIAKDATALANAAGGLVIIGVAEEDGRAATITPVSLAETERRRIVDVLTRRVSPLIPDLFVAELPISEGASTGLYLIAVPASDLAPHGVSRNDGYVWPVREDRQCRWMREPEIATRYRDRFTAAWRQVDRVAEVMQQGIARLDRRSIGWLALSVAPSRPGHLPTDSDATNAMSVWLTSMRQRYPGALGGQTATGRRRVIHSNVVPYRGFSNDQHLELHSDGCGFAAIRLFVPSFESVGPNLYPEPILSLYASDVEKWTLVQLAWLAEHALNAGAGGDLAVTAHLVPPNEAAEPHQEDLDHVPDRMTWQDQNGDWHGIEHTPIVVIEPVLVPGASGAMTRVGDRIALGGLRLLSPTPVETTAPLTVVTNLSDLVAASSQLAGELLAEFGVAWPRLLWPDGTVDQARSEPRAETLVDWARRNGLLRQS